MNHPLGARENVERILIDEQVIERRLDVMAEEIHHDFPAGAIVAVVLLKGAFVFAADLLRRIPRPLEIECFNVASYHGGTQSSGEVVFLDHAIPDLTNKNVLLLDDILDTGLTLSQVRKKLLEQGVSQVKTCVLLAKDRPRVAEVESDYTGFVINDEFVVGYGLDYMGHYRNLPYVGVLKDL